MKCVGRSLTVLAYSAMAMLLLCIVAEILRKKRWPIRLGVLLSPYVWVAGTGLVWSAAALLD